MKKRASLSSLSSTSSKVDSSSSFFGGAKEVRLRFSIIIQNLVLKKTGVSPWGGEYSVSIERGTGLKKKAVASWTSPSNGSGHREEQSKSGDSIIYLFTPAANASQKVPLTLTFDATLHKAENTAGFQPKTAKLIVKGKKLKGKGTWPIQNLGFLTLQLHQLAGSPNLDESIVQGDNVSEMSGADASFTRRLLEQCPFPGSIMHAAIAVTNTETNNSSDSTNLTSQQSESDNVFSSDDPFASSQSLPSLQTSQNVGDFDSYFNAFSEKDQSSRSPGRPRDVSDAFDPFSTAPTYQQQLTENSLPFINDDPFSDVAVSPTLQSSSATNGWDDGSFSQWTGQPTSPSVTPESSNTRNRNLSKSVEGDVSRKDMQRFQKELEAQRAVMAAQEQKIQQAADYVAYQEHCINNLTQQLQTSTAANVSQTRELEAAKTTIASLEKELLKNTESSSITPTDANPSVASALAAECVDAISLPQVMQQLELAHNEIKKLQLQLLQQTSSPDPGGENSIDSLQEKLQQAKEFIDYQTEQIELLQSGRTGDGTIVTIPASSDDLEIKLQQAAEYIAFQTEQLDAANEEINQLSNSLAAASAGGKHEGLDNEEELVKMQKELQDAKDLEIRLRAELGEEVKLRSANDEQFHLQLKELSLKLAASEVAIEDLRVAATAAEQRAAKVSADTEKEKLLIMKREKEIVAANAASFAAAAGRERQLEKMKQNDEETVQKLSADLKHAEEIVKHQSEQLIEQQAQIEELKESQKPLQSQFGGGAVVSETLVLELRQQLNDSSDVVSQQANQIESLLAEINGLKVEISQVEDLKEKLEQAKEFVDYQTEQLAQNQMEIATLSQTVALNAGNCTVSTDSESASTLEVALVAGSEAITIELEELRSKLQQAKEYIDYQTEQLETERADAELARQGGGSNNQLEMEKLRVQLLMASEGVDSVLRKSQILFALQTFSGAAATPTHYFVSIEAKLRAVETNLDSIGEKWSAQTTELNNLRDDLSKSSAEQTRLRSEMSKQQHESEDLHLANIYPSHSEDGRMMYLASQSEDPLDAEIMYGELERKLKVKESENSELELKLKAKEADVVSLNGTLESLNMSFQQKSKALDSCTAQVSCFRQVVVDAIERVFELRLKYLSNVEQPSRQQLQQQQRGLADEKQDILRAMQQAVPSNSWISQQLLNGLGLLVDALQQEKAAAVESARSSGLQDLTKERAEREIEVGKLLQELIEAKMNHAIAANEFEESRNSLRQLRRQLRSADSSYTIGSPMGTNASYHSN